MAIPLQDAPFIKSGKPSEQKYFHLTENRPWASVAEVNATIPKTYRHKELIVDIVGVLYWYSGDVEDVNLIPMPIGGGGGGTTTVNGNFLTAGGDFERDETDENKYNFETSAWNIDFVPNAEDAVSFNLPLAAEGLFRLDRPILKNDGTIEMLQGVEALKPQPPFYDPSLAISRELILVSQDTTEPLRNDYFYLLASDSRERITGRQVIDKFAELFARPIPSAELTFTYLEASDSMYWELIYDPTFLEFKILAHINLPGASPLTTKGDIYTYSTVNARLGVGGNGDFLVADSATSTGIKWETVAPIVSNPSNYQLVNAEWELRQVDNGGVARFILDGLTGLRLEYANTDVNDRSASYYITNASIPTIHAGNVITGNTYVVDVAFDETGIDIKQYENGTPATGLFTGIRADAYYVPASNFHYVQKKYVDDAITAAGVGTYLPFAGSTTQWTGQQRISDTGLTLYTQDFLSSGDWSTLEITDSEVELKSNYAATFSDSSLRVNGVSTYLRVEDGDVLTTLTFTKTGLELAGYYSGANPILGISYLEQYFTAAQVNGGTTKDLLLVTGKVLKDYVAAYGGAGGGAFIPLAGTTTAISGSLQINPTLSVYSGTGLNETRVYWDAGALFLTSSTTTDNAKLRLGSSVGGSYASISSSLDLGSGNYKEAELVTRPDLNCILVFGNGTPAYATFKGLQGNTYYGANYDDNTYAQAKYVNDQITAALITPTLGVTTATSINKVAITAPTTSAVLTLVTGSSLITAGAFSLTLTSTATTNVTFPTSGTLYGTATGSITSAQLMASISNETGSGLLVFNDGPNLIDLNVTNTYTGTSSPNRAIDSTMTYAPSANTSNGGRAYGVYGKAITDTSAFNIVDTAVGLSGIYGWSTYIGTGTLTWGVGGYFIVSNDSTGTITNGVGVKIATVSNGGGGAMTNSYGLFIDDIDEATNNWAIRTKNGIVQLQDNVALFQNPSFGTGTKVLFIGNASAVPSTNPTAGGILYTEDGAMKYRGSSGTVTTIANA